ncbi:14981_t:CDS:2 [Cetraspora pellucida]|uniref:14981_t:CDS:1 n=1 Tax=Cetraspora pellucida TaxID=1433469 RepID=A0A9N9IM24_9GLOM|nr:14981_t:CDS:2 [Cetraspora pellucida]
MEDFEENNYSISYFFIDNNEIDNLSVNSSCINDDTMEVNETGKPLQLCTRSFVWKYFVKKKKPLMQDVPELNKEKKKLNVSVIDMLQNQQTVNNHSSEPFDLNIFKDLIKHWIANVLSADSIKRYVMNDFEKEHRKLMVKLQRISEKFSVMTDIWIMNTNEKFFIAVTLHYLNTS